MIVAALGLMMVGMLFKVSAAPFHVWTPDVYEGAPSPVVALMSTAPKAAVFALLLRVIYEMLPSLRSVWAPLLWVVAVISMTVGNLAALRQQNVKRMLAYSSIAHAGYLLAAFAGFGNERHCRCGFLYRGLCGHERGHLRGGHAGQRIRRTTAADPTTFAACSTARRCSAVLLIFFLISLIGIPFTGGFFGKFYSFSAAVGGGAVLLAIIGLLNSGIASAYYLRLAFAAAQRPDESNGRTQLPLPQIGIAVGAALLFTVGTTLALGIVPGKALHAAETAAHTLQVPQTEPSVPEISLQPHTASPRNELGGHGSASSGAGSYKDPPSVPARDGVPYCSMHPSACCSSHAMAIVGFANQAHDSFRDRLRIAWRNQQPGHLGNDGVARTCGQGRDHRNAGGCGFQHHVRKSFPPRGQHHHVHGPVVGRRVGNKPGASDARDD